MYIYLNLILLSHEKNEIMSFVVTWMDLEIIILGEVSQAREICNIAYMWNLNKERYKWTYLQNRNRPIDIENKFMVTKGKRERREKLGVWD